MFTLNGTWIDFSRTIGVRVPHMYLPKGYLIEKYPATFTEDETIYHFAIERGFDRTCVAFTFHVPNKGKPYWLIDSNLKRKIPSQKTDSLISKIQSNMTKQRKSREGFGYYL